MILCNIVEHRISITLVILFNMIIPATNTYAAMRKAETRKNYDFDKFLLFLCTYCLWR